MAAPPTAAGKGGCDDEGVSKANRPHIRSPEAIKINTWLSSLSFPLYGTGLACPSTAAGKGEVFLFQKITSLWLTGNGRDKGVRWTLFT
jgi:hypothetical protein